MGLFSLSRREKETWTSIVIQGIKPDMQVGDALLKNATESSKLIVCALSPVSPFSVTSAGS